MGIDRSGHLPLIWPGIAGTLPFGLVFELKWRPVLREVSALVIVAGTVPQVVFQPVGVELHSP